MDSLKMLSIRDALRLYQLVAPHIPRGIDEDDPAVTVIKRIIDSMKDKNPRDYLDSVLLMSGKSIEDLQKLDSIKILDLFVEGLSVNQIIYLDSFCKNIGLKHA